MLIVIDVHAVLKGYHAYRSKQQVGAVLSVEREPKNSYDRYYLRNCVD